MKIVKWGMLFASIFLVTLANFSVRAENISADVIVQKANISAYYGGEDGRSIARMQIFDSAGRKQLRQFVVLRKNLNLGGEQNMLVVFSRPSDVKDTVFMVHKKPQGNDDRWLYLPALDLVKRISAGDKRTSFVGAHYFYEDISGRSPNEDKHELLETTESHFILKHTPIDTESVEFSHYITQIDKSTFLPTTIEFFKENNKRYRVIEAKEIQVIEEIPTVLKAKITDLESGGYTLLEFKSVNYNLGIPESIFSERSLRNPPNKWLKGK